VTTLFKGLFLKKRAYAMDIGALGLQSPRKKTALIANRPTIYTLTILVAVLMAFAYKLRNDDIFSCQANGYTSDRYLAYCNGIGYGDYEHGAFWFDLEPSVTKFLVNADVIFLGDSHSQFGFSTDTTNQWFSSASSRYYLLGFGYGENVAFEGEILHRLQPRAKVYVIPVNFFERSETSLAQEVMHDPTSRYRYEKKKHWQFAHRQICEKISAFCRHKFAFYRSRETGAYQAFEGNVGPFGGALVDYKHEINQEKVKYYSASGQSFLSQLSVGRDCVILTLVPTVHAHEFVYLPSFETAEAVAKELGVNFVSAKLDSLKTFDGSHLAKSSAERWSKAFFQEAGPQILRCLKEPSKSRI
jgi:hypothetical protein